MYSVSIFSMHSGRCILFWVSQTQTLWQGLGYEEGMKGKHQWETGEVKKQRKMALEECAVKPTPMGGDSD